MEISKLFGKPKTYTIAGQEMTFRPLEMKEIDLVFMAGDKEKQAEGVKGLVTVTLKKSYSELRDEDIEKISLEHFEAITKAVMDINNMKEK